MEATATTKTGTFCQESSKVFRRVGCCGAHPVRSFLTMMATTGDAGPLLVLHVDVNKTIVISDAVRSTELMRAFLLGSSDPLSHCVLSLNTNHVLAPAAGERRINQLRGELADLRVRMGKGQGDGEDQWHQPGRLGAPHRDTAR